uniref:Uncharacterized protein n=1 Tax=Triticum urartu TaxID=4572 RepID=A0A8R7Q2J4_TRIUA
SPSPIPHLSRARSSTAASQCRHPGSPTHAAALDPHPCLRLVPSPPHPPPMAPSSDPPSTPPLEVSGKFTSDLRERPGDLASVHSTQ